MRRRESRRSHRTRANPWNGRRATSGRPRVFHVESRAHFTRSTQTVIETFLEERNAAEIAVRKVNRARWLPCDSSRRTPREAGNRTHHRVAVAIDRGVRDVVTETGMRATEIGDGEIGRLRRVDAAEPRA